MNNLYYLAFFSLLITACSTRDLSVSEDNLSCHNLEVEMANLDITSYRLKSQEETGASFDKHTSYSLEVRKKYLNQVYQRRCKSPFFVSSSQSVSYPTQTVVTTSHQQVNVYTPPKQTPAVSQRVKNHARPVISTSPVVQNQSHRSPVVSTVVPSQPSISVPSVSQTQGDSLPLASSSTMVTPQPSIPVPPVSQTQEESIPLASSSTTVTTQPSIPVPPVIPGRPVSPTDANLLTSSNLPSAALSGGVASPQEDPPAS